MIDRIKEIMDYKGLTSSQFADTVEVPRAVISHILSGRNNPSLEVVTKIVSAFPEFNINWVLLGEGGMLTKLANKIVQEPISVASEAESIAEAKADVESPLKTEKVQNKIKPKAEPVDQVKDDKEIEQIVIFYTDKTFIAYKP